MAESLNSLSSRGISDYAQGAELNKDLLNIAEFSPNLSPGQHEVVGYNFDMAGEQMDETVYSEQFCNNTYEALDGCFSDITNEHMIKARYEEHLGNKKYEKIETPSPNQPPHPTMLGESEDSFPKSHVLNSDKDECGCSICLEYHRDKSDCGCSICLEYHRDRSDCDCSICLEYHRDKSDCGRSICLEYHYDIYDCRCSICLEYY